MNQKLRVGLFAGLAGVAGIGTIFFGAFLWEGLMALDYMTKVALSGGGALASVSGLYALVKREVPMV